MPIDNKTLAFTIPFVDNGTPWTLYIPVPSKERVLSAAPVLGYLYSLRQNTSLLPAVIAKDYEIYAKEACVSLVNKETITEREKEKKADDLFKAFKSFIEASLLAGHAIGADFLPVRIIDIKDKISEDVLNDACGLYVFFYAIYRYAFQYLNETERKGFSTSLNLMEFTKLMQTLSSDAEALTPKETA